MKLHFWLKNDSKKWSRGFVLKNLSSHTCKNLIPMVVTRAMANSSKNHALLMCRMWKMGWNLFSSLDKKGIFSDVQWWKQISTHFSDSTHQECMIFARIGHGPCYYHCNEIFAGVCEKFSSGSINPVKLVLSRLIHNSFCWMQHQGRSYWASMTSSSRFSSFCC